MPILKSLADTNTISDFIRTGNPVKQWFSEHRGQMGLSTLTLAEMRRGMGALDSRGQEPSIAL